MEDLLMKFSQLKVSALNIIIIILMTIVSLFSYFSFISVQKASNFIVDDTIPIVKAAQNLLQDLINQETGIRGYLISEDKKFLEHYNLGVKNLKEDLTKIIAYANANSIVLKGLIENKAIPKIDTIEAFYQSQIDLVQNGKVEVARPRINNGKQNMDEFRNINVEIINEVSRITNASQSAANSSSALSRFIIILGILMSVIAGIVSILLYKRSAKADRLMRENAENLEQQNEEIISQQLEQEAILQKLTELVADNEQQYWLKNQFARITGLSQGNMNLEKMVSLLISEIAKLVEAGQGVFYVKDTNKKSLQFGEFVLLGSYAYTERKNISSSFRVGQGLVGQSVFEKKPILLTNVPGDYIHIQSGLGESKPLTLLVVPIVFEEEVIAVIELASFQMFTKIQQDLLEQISAALGVIIDSVTSRQRTEQLLKESQVLAQELQSQQEELRISNGELEEQTTMLKRSEEKLKIQSEELQAINEEMEVKTSHLEMQKADIEKQNQLIQISKQEIEIKAKELELASKYKSEFLANMSHELRTPLNSLLILSKSLAGNAEQNLTEDQVESAKVIYSGGLDLLTLINDILDLSKVEAGKLDIQPEEIRIDSILHNLHNQFNHVAKDKGVQFLIEKEENLPQTIITDGQRTEQILKNLLSNAFKFTMSGTITLRFERPSPQIKFINSKMTADNAVALIVRDTGIGIPNHKQKAIFGAFQQADGSTSRKYGGTGLGLTISRELSKLLGGEIQLESMEGKGSSFTLYLPLDGVAQAETAMDPFSPIKLIKEAENSIELEAFVGHTLAAAAVDEDGAIAEPYPVKVFIADDREQIQANGKEKSKVALIIEDDKHFAKVLLDLSRKKGFKCMVAGDGFSGVQLAKQYIPSAVLLDLGLPDMNGLKVLDHLKYNNETRHIPVHIISGNEDSVTSLSRGAIGFLSKPISSEDMDAVFARIDDSLSERTKQILVVEDDVNNQKAIYELLKHKKIEIDRVYTGKEALEHILLQDYDCIILDLKLPDMTGFEMLEKLVEYKSSNVPPIIINTGKELTQDEYKELNRFTDSIVIKGVNSPERLLDEVSLFLHSVQKLLPPDQRQRIRMIHDSDHTLKGRKILLVDDDLRNTFALSKILKQHGLEVVMADNGKLALDKLENEAGIELVIMDIMMPIMDGYEAMKRIRGNPEHQTLPIIALTAKAMTGDREKCIEGGANDYMTKPVNTDNLLSLIRVWLFK
jgi:CheY-like chemotaxis protein/CHASE3 domain sensor protein/putative methionine-R-sulfoxide reductase with GAF domain